MIGLLYDTVVQERSIQPNVLLELPPTIPDWLHQDSVQHVQWKITVEQLSSSFQQDYVMPDITVQVVPE